MRKFYLLLILFTIYHSLFTSYRLLGQNFEKFSYSADHYFDKKFIYCADFNDDTYKDVIAISKITTNWPHHRMDVNILYNDNINSFDSISEIIFSSYWNNNDGELNIDINDFDKDNDLDILFSGRDSVGLPICKLLRDENNVFNEYPSILDNINIIGDIKWFDFNNDGYLDIIISGRDENTFPITKILINDNGFYKESDIYMPLVAGQVDIQDINRDGLKDLLIVGVDINENHFQSIFINHYTEFFEIELPDTLAIHMGKFIDFNDDGLTDILVCASPISYNSPSIYILENIGEFTFETKLVGSFGDLINNLSAVDLNNNGNIEILASSDYSQLKIFYDNGNSYFTDTLLTEETFDLSDINNDNKIDILTSDGFYINKFTNSNIAPTTPETLDSKVQGNDVYLYWNPSIDDLYSHTSINYNIEVRGKDNSYLLNSLSRVDGERIISTKFNVGKSDSIILYNLNPDEYNFKVQAIDINLNSSTFSIIDTFLIKQELTRDTSLLGLWGSGPAIGEFDNDNDLDIYVYDMLNENKIYDIKELNVSVSGSMHPIWCDVNNDNYIDLIKGDSIYLNNKGSFEQRIYLGGDKDRRKSFGDFDNDGDYDLIIGDKLFINNNLIFKKIELPAEYWWVYNFVDYDNDYDNDLIFKNELFLNDNGELTNTLLFNVESNGYFSNWFDVNNDKQFDCIIISGEDNNRYVNLYLKENTSYKLNKTPLKAYWENRVYTGDYDNDGYNDAIISEFNSGAELSIYVNNKSNNFERYYSDNIGGDDVNLADIDNDGDNDIVQSQFVLWNNGYYPNDPPAAPSNLRTQRNGYGIIFGWNEATDAQSTEGGLSYNLRVGTTPGGVDIMSPMSDVVNGYRRIPKMGNCQMNLGWRLDTLSEGTYYWAVQAIDQSFMGGEWSEEQSFKINVVRADFYADTALLGDTTHFTENSITEGNLTAWKWFFDDGDSSIVQNPEHVYELAGIYNVKYIAYKEEFSDTIIKPVKVKSPIVANFNADTVCLGNYTSFIELSYSNVDTVLISSWLWDFGDGTSSNMQIPSNVRYLNPGVYLVKLKIGSIEGYNDSIQKNVIVGSYPNPVISSNKPLDICSGDSITLSTHYYSNYSYKWLLNDIFITDANLYYTNAIYQGKYTVRVTNSYGGCSVISPGVDVILREIPNPFSIATSGAEELCVGDSLILSTPFNSNIDYIWKYDDIPIGIDTNIYIAISTGKYSLVQRNSFNCYEESSNSINVVMNNKPEFPVISMNGSLSFCEGDSIVLSVKEQPGVSYKWSNEQGVISSANNNEYVAYNNGSYFVEIANEYDCKNTSKPTKVTVSEMPGEQVVNESGYDKSDCPQEKIITLSIDQATAQYTYQWLRNGVILDGEIESALADYLNEGDYSVIATNNGCENESDIVGIYYDPELPEKPGIIATGPNVWYLACTNDEAEQYEWYYNNEIISGANEYLYVADQDLGTYFVKIAEENGCFVSSDAVTIHLTATGIDDPNPFANLKIYPNPTPGVFTIEMDNQIYGELITRIFSQNAVEILNIKFDKSTQHFKAQVDLSGQGKGLYIISFLLDKYKAERKLVVE